jgi:hypothetical protein
MALRAAGDGVDLAEDKSKSPAAAKTGRGGRIFAGGQAESWSISRRAEVTQGRPSATTTER